jgi:hypothetical protein
MPILPRRRHERRSASKILLCSVLTPPSLPFCATKCQSSSQHKHLLFTGIRPVIHVIILTIMPTAHLIHKHIMIRIISQSTQHSTHLPHTRWSQCPPSRLLDPRWALSPTQKSVRLHYGWISSLQNFNWILMTLQMCISIPR